MTFLTFRTGPAERKRRFDRMGPVATRSRPENDSGVDLPETRYAKTVDGLSIAYQVLGQGPVDLVFTTGWMSNVDDCWDVPQLRSFFHQLASISRLILFDRARIGTLGSAYPGGITGARAWGGWPSSGYGRGGVRPSGPVWPRGWQHARRDVRREQPDRTVALVLFAPWAKALKAHWPVSASEADLEEWERHTATEWGTTAFYALAVHVGRARARERQCPHPGVHSLLARVCEPGRRTGDRCHESRDRRPSGPCVDPRADPSHESGR